MTRRKSAGESPELREALKVVERELGVKLRKRDLADLKPDPQNTRTHNDRNRGLIIESIKEVGAARSIVTDANDVTRAGNATISVAESAGISEGIEVETRGDRLLIHKRGDLKDERKAKRLSIADNAATDASGWDVERLAFHMREDETLFDGIFDEDDDVLHKIRKAIAGTTQERDEEFDPDAIPPGKVVSKRGDVWECGRHRVMCGSATDQGDVQRLVGKAKIHMVYTDPPYGIAVVNVENGTVDNQEDRRHTLKTGTVGGGGAFGGKKNEMRGAAVIAAKKYAPIIGDDSTETAIAAWQLAAGLFKKAIHIWWGGNHYASALPDSKCWIVWDKENGDSNFADAELAWTNMDRGVRLFRHKWNGMLKASERGEARVHPTQKPVALAVWCMERFGDGGDNVLDLFGGSGSTLLGAESTQRTAYIMEMSEPYVDIIVARWEHVTGQKAKLIKGGADGE